MNFNKKHKLLAGAILAIISIVGIAFERDYTSPEKTIKRMCEESLLKRLKAPSGYKAINYTMHKEEMNKDDFLNYSRKARASVPLSKYELDSINSGSIKPVVYGLDIDYDAPNGFGAVIRNSAYCEYVSEFGEGAPLSSTFVFLDGETESSYLLNQLKNMSGKAPDIQPSARSIKLQRELEEKSKN